MLRKAGGRVIIHRLRINSNDCIIYFTYRYQGWTSPPGYRGMVRWTAVILIKLDHLEYFVFNLMRINLFYLIFLINQFKSENIQMSLCIYCVFSYEDTFSVNKHLIRYQLIKFHCDRSKLYCPGRAIELV